MQRHFIRFVSSIYSHGAAHVDDEANNVRPAE